MKVYAVYPVRLCPSSLVYDTAIGQHVRFGKIYNFNLWSQLKAALQ
jgi:hypothetical protein